MSHAHVGGLPEGLLAGAMWQYSLSVLYPAQALRRSGLLPPPTVLGEPPEPVNRRGLGPWFSRLHERPVLLERATEHDHLVEEFDRMGEVYDAFVKPFSTPLFDEAIREMHPWLPRDARVLDAGCGAGRELQRIARLVPEGEVVGIDLAAGMVEAAHRDARAHGLSRCAFFQSDVGDLPEEFTGQFDLIYNSLAHHHYPDPPAAAREVHRCLRPGGVYCVVDPGPRWFNLLSARFAKWSDPGWISFHTPDEFRSLMAGAGFARTSWRELLPGFGLAVGQKACNGAGSAAE
ncbi:MAG TPA: methyltransferase domain-containing protein [Longimicrobiaceae bacterium]|nr:methyltransferase domain-containing protein [Longimicrobiaceae bacterium]